MPSEPQSELSSQPELSPRLGRIRFRAWHRGTREADYMIGCFFDRFHAAWSENDIQWFENLLEEDDVDIMAWALKTFPVPERFAGSLMTRMQQLDYVDIPR
ncbi:succinate dehydrogenase assembly factor 2 [Novosphingobium sp. RD2P27]|uniref:FAD assembly factor SdhE n=1 Tax=Novosphingobium kalidii TaxID=3230299 RepID=A0ABV2D389_9SPHN